MHLIRKVEDGPNMKVKVFRIDRGGEFVLKESNAYCKEAGINRHYSVGLSKKLNKSETEIVENHKKLN